MAKWLGSWAPLRWPGISPVWIPAPTWHCSSGHAEAASHVAQPEALTTGIYNYVLGGGFGETKEKKKKKTGNRC